MLWLFFQVMVAELHLVCHCQLMWWKAWHWRWKMIRILVRPSSNTQRYTVLVCSFFVSQLAFLSACFLALMHRYVRLSVAWSVDLLTSVFLFLYTSLLTPVFVWLSVYMAFCICLSAQLFSSLECSGFLSLFVIVWLYSTVRLSVSVRRSNWSVSLPLLLLPAHLPDYLVSVCLPAWLLGVWLYVCMYVCMYVGR